MIYSGTDMEIYLDGQLDSFVSFSGEIATTTYDLVLGRARPDQDFYFEGRLDEIYLFDHALSPTHIKEIYENVTATLELNPIQESILVFPNPAKESLFIDFSSLPELEFSYQLIDISGRTVLSGNSLNSNKSQLYLNTGHIQAGLYLLKIKADEFSAVNKILISN